MEKAKRKRGPNLIGQKFASLTVIAQAAFKPPYRGQRWLCRCDCGSETIRRQTDLNSGYAKSCGCARLIDLQGRRFSRLLVVVRIDAASAPRRREPYWRCLCDCGTEKICSSNNLISGRTRSCGCYQRELAPPRLRHGYARKGRVTGIWATWQGIKTRSFDVGDPSYGGRGITMCSGWEGSFESFLKDMGEKPAGQSIDRIDNDDGYHCGHCGECIANGWKQNCRWATAFEQGRNKRNNRYASIHGERRLIIEWAERFGMVYRLVMGRIYRGATPEEALLRHG